MTWMCILKLGNSLKDNYKAYAKDSYSYTFFFRPLLWSLLGFNLSIKLMQMAIVALVIPWLSFLSQTSLYMPIRMNGAILAGVAANSLGR